MTLAAVNLGYGYRGRTVGRGAEFELQAGKILCLLGPNGGGKTTLFKTLLGLLPAQEGCVLLDGQDLSRWPRRRFARHIAYVPQAHDAFFPFLVRDVVVMGRAAHIGLFAQPSAADHRAADGALAALGVGHLADRIYTQISGGERQLALIARALAQEPKILVMDEPTASLDFGNQVRVLAQIKALAASGIAILLSTHDPDHAFLCADQVALLHDGRIIALGPPEETVTAETLKVVYGIDVAVVTLPGSDRRICTPSLAGLASTSNHHH
jgi:iron complex transport system ATP-binding protein